MAKINVEGLSFSYGSVTGLEEVEIDISSGEMVGIIGPNGSGKSTLLKVMSGLLVPQKGGVVLNDMLLSQLSPKNIAREISVVPQNTSAGFNFTVEEVVSMGRHPYLGRWGRMEKEDKQAVEEALDLTHCNSFRHRSFLELSGGEQQRVVLARALAQAPQVILLDEPTSHLDLGYQKEIWEVLSKLNRERGITVIAVMHDLNLAAQYCRRLLLLQQGKIYAVGAPEGVLTQEIISDVYGCEVTVQKHFLTGAPQVGLVPREQPQGLEQLKGIAVHVIGGGGSASGLLRLLKRNGAAITSGVLHRGDTDWSTCRDLDIPCGEEVPFAPVSEEKHRENLSQCLSSHLVVLAAVYIGWGNAKNVEAAWWACKEGIPVILVDRPPIEERDYSGGKAVNLVEEMKKEGAVPVQELSPEVVKEVISKQ